MPREVAACSGVEDHGRGVRAGMLGHHGHLVALAPGLQLLHRRGAEGVAGREHHLLAVVLELFGQLADGGGLAGAVDAHHEDDPRLALGRLVLGLLRRLQDGGQLGAQLAAQGLGIGQLAPAYPRRRGRR